MDYLSEKEMRAVEKFLNDSTMAEAVRKVLLSGVYIDGKLEKDKPADPLKNFMLAAFTTQTAALMTFEEKGRKLETIINAISLVESGFKEMEKCKSIKSEVKVEPNRAR